MFLENDSVSSKIVRVLNFFSDIIFCLRYFGKQTIHSCNIVYPEFQTNPVVVELFSHGNTFFRSNKFAWLLDT